MKITLVRHAQTDANYESVMQGLKNNLLNDTGRRQCQKLREEIKDIKFDYCYMSPLARTVETAMILIGDRVEMIPDKRLLERDMGNLEGAAVAQYDAKKYWNYELNCSDDGVEDIQSIFERCENFLSYILEKYDESSHILVVSHGAPLRALYHLLKQTRLTRNLLDIAIGNCYCETFEVQKEELLQKK